MEPYEDDPESEDDNYKDYKDDHYKEDNLANDQGQQSKGDQNDQPFPECFNVTVETTDPATKKPLVCHIGLLFKKVRLNYNSFGYAPAVVYFNNAITGEKYTQERSKRHITPDLLRRAIESLRWLAWVDPDIDTESRDLINTTCGEYGKD